MMDGRESIDGDDECGCRCGWMDACLCDPVVREKLIQSRVSRLKIPNVPFYEVEYEDGKESKPQVNG